MARRRKVFSGQVGDIDLRLIRVFKAVAECGSLSAAQTKLGLSLPTISKHLSDLETRFGMRLCHRDRSGFHLTQQGEQALAYIDELLAAVDHFQTNVAGLNEKLVGRIEIGVVDFAVSDENNPLIQAIAKYREAAPHVTITPRMGAPSEVERGVIDGTFHVGIVPDYQRLSGLEYAYLYDETAGLYCGGQHPLAQAILNGGPLAEEEVYKHELVHRGFFESDNLRQVKQKFPVGSVVDQTEALLALVRSGVYLGFFPIHCAKAMAGEVHEILPEAFRYSMPICAVFRRNRHRSAVLREFLELVLEDRADSPNELPQAAAP